MKRGLSEAALEGSEDNVGSSGVEEESEVDSEEGEDAREPVGGSSLGEGVADPNAVADARAVGCDDAVGDSLAAPEREVARLTEGKTFVGEGLEVRPSEAEDRAVGAPLAVAASEISEEAVGAEEVEAYGVEVGKRDAAGVEVEYAPVADPGGVPSVLREGGAVGSELTEPNAPVTVGSCGVPVVDAVATEVSEVVSEERTVGVGKAVPKLLPLAPPPSEAVGARVPRDDGLAAADLLSERALLSDALAWEDADTTTEGV